MTQTQYTTAHTTCMNCGIIYDSRYIMKHICITNTVGSSIAGSLGQSTPSDKATIGSDTPPILGTKVNPNLFNDVFTKGYAQGWIDAWEYWAKKKEVGTR